MKKSKRLLKKIDQLAENIAKLSAIKDERDNSWWGNDTELGNLPFYIKEKIMVFLENADLKDCWGGKNKMIWLRKEG